MRRIAAVLAATVLVVGGCAQSVDDPAPSTPSSAPVSETDSAQQHLVNLGDSFSAAAGVQPLVAGSPVMCLRSSLNFAHLVAADGGFRLTDVSCSGADTTDFTDPQYEGVAAQLDAITDDSDVITVMIGGNDSALYSTAIRECSDLAAQDVAGAPCQAEHGDDYTDIIESDTYPALVEALGEVRARAPDADMLVVGYPWILPASGGCYPTMRVAAGDVPYLRALQADLNDAIRRAAERSGARFVDMSAVSEGRDACAPSGQRWIEPQNGASGAAPVHPNAEGQRAIADQVSAALE
ncbi:SGNH/GDSL hydrolase family protein [Gordonia sp. PKS22-38]|uniref:SGNH/GDSL hydrolase family protein n=1 Tax=Gordonia prachuapensis TaxID=3115651 RepID=A0ABU7MZT0_9ACTN|nr:SGNH/GDSL hydrolase family protein [Gordonia sp. PKS22-38]